ncbi:MAG: hypothetical protein NXH82_15190 [Rhodobacteraceae bacterium]|nr:hypothetical protein [Paracoccaceae bacterium]
MSDALPEYYFRIRENGAVVFRVDAGNRNRRLELDPIAVVNTRNGEVKPQGNRTLSEADRAHIGAWLDRRRAALTDREARAAGETVEAMNLTAQWAQSRATDAELEAITEDLLLAMHDLRAVLVRKKSERLSSGG